MFMDMMTKMKEQIIKNVELNKQLMLDAERWLWAHPQTGFTEWEADSYLSEKFTELGYTLIKAGNIPGFYTDVDTGKPGPMLCIIGELDALDISGHIEAVNGMSHACGHNAQGAALLGIAAALKMPGALEGLCGKIRLMATPAEEMIQLEFREELRKKGIISYIGGKTEFMHRGFFDDVDLAILVHVNTNEDGIEYKCSYGFNGCMAKTIKYKGRAAHAGCAAHIGVNAQYAAMLGLQACNALRETFVDDDHIRFHPIMKGVTTAVNIIPDEMPIETYIRGRSVAAIKHENRKINRALAGAALAMGAQVEIHDRPGYSPEVHDPKFMKVVEQCCADLVGADKVEFHYSDWGASSSDFGDITEVMPGVQLNAAGAVGVCHSVDYYMKNPERFCMNSAKLQLWVAATLLKDDAAIAKDIIASYKPTYSSIKEYFKAINEIILDKEAVVYDEKGNATVDFQ